MIRKTHGVDAQACCFSVALLLKADGTKFGKSESGAIYLDPTITSPYTMYQFLINQNDNDVESLLKRLTFLSKEEIEDIMNKQRAEPFKRIAQKELAKNIVIDIHGKEQYEKVLQISEALFSGDLTKLDNQTLYDALSGTNVFNISNDSINIADLLVESNICKSKSEARKLIEQNAISVNGKLINLIDTNITKADAIENKFSYIKKGKRDYTLINFN
jgi:tyrosyl-tRNA synthetase